MRKIIPSQITCKADDTELLRSDTGECSQKPDKCTDIYAASTSLNPFSGLQIESSWSCPTCFRVIGGFKVPDYFDNKDWVDIRFSHPVEDIPKGFGITNGYYRIEYKLVIECPARIDTLSPKKS
mgnify:CR=1 FL=1